MDEYIKKSDVELIYSGLKEVAEGQMKVTDTIGMITLKGLMGGIDMLMEGVKSLAPADVVPVVHGMWMELISLEPTIFGGFMPKPVLVCSECGRKAKVREPYCHCGAKMDGHTTPAYRMGQRLKARCNHDR